MNLHSSMDRAWHKVVLLPLIALSLSLLPAVDDGEEISRRTGSISSLPLLLLPLLPLSLLLPLPMEDGEEFWTGM